jgi:hypothetical protein
MMGKRAAHLEDLPMYYRIGYYYFYLDKYGPVDARIWRDFAERGLGRPPCRSDLDKVEGAKACYDHLVESATKGKL